jgi:hypothetical protein
MVTRARAAIAMLVPASLVAMLSIAGMALARIYSGDLTPRLLVGAAAGAVAVSLATSRLPAWSAAPASVPALAGYTLLAVHLSAQAGSVPGGLGALTADALRNGIPRLLTAMIPIEPQPDTVLVPVLATWLAGLAGAELAVRGRRVLLGYAAPTLLYGAALYLVGPNSVPALWQPLAFAGCAAVGLAASAATGRTAEPDRTADRRAAKPDPGAEPDPAARPDPAGHGRTAETDLAAGGRPTALRVRMAAGTLGGLAAVVALAAALGPPVARQVTASPPDPRRYVTPPQLDALDENPLVRLSGWALNPDQHLFDVRLSGAATRPDAPAETRMRLAVLGDYDGVTWRVGATYRSAGRVLSGPARPGTGSTAEPSVTQKITLAELDGRLLPALAEPRRVDGLRVAYDPGSGTLALPDGLRPGLAYSVESHPSTVDTNVLPAADVPSGPAVARFLGLGSGPPPPEMSRLAGQLAEGQGAPYQRALAVEQFIGEHYQLVGDAPSGHGYPNLTFFLFGPRAAGGQRGTSEQFAAAFAVLARMLGLPTRVVVGFRVPRDRSAVRGEDALAWPEVLFNGAGWVPFDPLPQPNSSPRPVEDDFRPKPNPPTPPPSPAPAPSLSRPAASPSPSQPPAAAPAGIPPGTLLAGTAGGIGLLVLGYLLAVPLLRRAQRRRRLFVGDPSSRVAGAWREVVDALRLAGQPPPAHLSATEVAGHAVTAAGRHGHAHRPGAVRLPAPRLDDLAALLNTVGFGPAGADEEDARRAAAQAVAYVGELRARRGWWRRLLWSVDPRPLRWARHG